MISFPSNTSLLVVSLTLTYILNKCIFCLKDFLIILFFPLFWIPPNTFVLPGVFPFLLKILWLLMFTLILHFHHACFLLTYTLKETSSFEFLLFTFLPLLINPCETKLLTSLFSPCRTLND